MDAFNKFFCGNTRLKFALIYIVVVFVQGMVTVLFSSFPFMEAVGTQGAVVIGYITGKSITDNSFEAGRKAVKEEMISLEEERMK
jgi:hypothetical protein